jgi:hypothetical protein
MPVKTALFVGYVFAVGAALLQSGSSLGSTLGYLLIGLTVLVVAAGATSYVKRRFVL